MEFKKGDRVQHPSKEDWGLGEVLEKSNGESVRVFFVEAGEKTLSLKHVQLLKVAASESAHPVLDNLKISKTQSGIKYQSLTQSISFFLEQFPQGFYGAKFREHERDYKDKTHALAQVLLSKTSIETQLSGSNYAEVTKQALKVVNASNLIFPNEKMALKDGLADPLAQRSFSKTLYSYLHSPAALEERFDGFANALSNIDAAKWTIASYFLFVVHPSKYMFVKPTITQYAAELCG